MLGLDQMVEVEAGVDVRVEADRGDFGCQLPTLPWWEKLPM
jgi:hypothetical protein